MTETSPADPETKVTVLLATRTPEHALPEYTLNETVPVGLIPPVTVALSATGFPTTIEIVDNFVLTTKAPPTLTVSVPQRLVAGLLLVSPFLFAFQLKT